MSYYRKYSLCKPAANQQTSVAVAIFSGLLAFAGTQGAESKQSATKPAAQQAAFKSAGRQVYLKQCVSCHGAKGEGTKTVPEPLAGSRSVGELTRFIAKTMPPGPHRCPPADTPKVAAYIYDAFYSPLAQARNKTAR